MSLIRFASLSSLTLLAAPVPAQQRTRAAPPPPAGYSVSIQQRLVIRVPRLPAGRMALPAQPTKWREKRADRCVPAQQLAAAAVTKKDSVDLVLNGGRRIRARFDDDCPALDFYSGFYVRMNADGQVCAKRDVIRARSGGECRIESFRNLVPDK